MEEQAIKNNNGMNYFIIFIIVAITNSVIVYGYNTFIKQKDQGSSIILENISNLNAKIKELSEIVKLNNAQVKITDRLDAGLIQKFGEDSEFLEKIVTLKKQIIKRELESKIIKLESEKLARNLSGADGYYANGYKKETAAAIFELMMINATTKKAVIRVEDNIANVGIGDSIRGFVITDITANQVTMNNPDGDKEILGLSYLTKKIYNKKGEGKNAK